MTAAPSVVVDCAPPPPVEDAEPDADADAPPEPPELPVPDGDAPDAEADAADPVVALVLPHFTDKQPPWPSISSG